MIRRILRQRLDPEGNQATCVGSGIVVQELHTTNCGLQGAASSGSAWLWNDKAGQNEVLGELRYGAVAVPAGRREVPCMIMLALALSFSSLQTITHVSAHALPPRGPEDRGALWNPVSRPSLRA